MDAKEAIALAITSLEKSATEPHCSAAQSVQLQKAQVYSQLAIALLLQSFWERETMYDLEVEQV